MCVCARKKRKIAPAVKNCLLFFLRYESQVNGCFLFKKTKMWKKKVNWLAEISSAGKKCCFVEVLQLFVASFRKKSSVDWEVFVSTKRSLLFESESSCFLFFNFFFLLELKQNQRTYAELESQRNNCFCFLFFPLRSRKNLFCSLTFFFFQKVY